MAAQSTLRHEDPLLALYTHYKTLIRTRLQSTSRNVRLLATIVLLLSITSGGVLGHRWWKKSSTEKEQGRRLHRRNSGLKHKDGSRTIFVPYKDSTSKVTIHPTKPTTFDAHRRLFLNPPRAAGLSSSNGAGIPPRETKPGLNLAFLHQFLSLLSIMIPRWGSKETGLLVSHGIFLMLRTYLSLVVARLDGEIVRDLVAGNGKSFIWGIVKVCLISNYFS
jgi:ATP-binding cassette subfamily D (ALD) long-chain fatty acid import protein